MPVQGAAVLVAAAWAGFAGYLVTSFVGRPSLLAGLIFGLLILTVDVTIMWWIPVGKWAPAALIPRVAIIVATAFVVSIAVVCWFFGSSINQQLRTEASTQRAVATKYAFGPTSPETKAVKADNRDITEANNKVTQDTQAVDSALGAYNDEIADGSGPDPLPGNGPVATQKLFQLQNDRTTLANDTAAAGTTQTTETHDIAEEQTARLKYISTWVHNHSGAKDLAARIRALDVVAQKDPFISWLRWALLVIGAAIDATAIALRLGGRRRFEHRRQLDDNAQDEVDDDHRQQEVGYEKERTRRKFDTLRLGLQGQAEEDARTFIRSRRPGSTNARRRLVAGVGAAAIAVAIVAALISDTGSHASPSPRTPTQEVLSLPDGGTLRIPGGSLTRGAHVAVGVVTKSNQHANSLPSAMQSGQLLPDAKSGQQLKAAGAPLTLRVKGGSIKGPVMMSFPVKSAVPAGESPTVSTYNSKTQQWMALPSHYDPSTRTVSTELGPVTDSAKSSSGYELTAEYTSILSDLTSFIPTLLSDLDSAVNRVEQDELSIEGLATPAPKCAAPIPSWVSASFPPNAYSIRGCATPDPNTAGEVDVEITDDRPFGQMINVSGAPLNFAYESGSLNELHDLGVTLSGHGVDVLGTSSSMYLAPQQEMILGFTDDSGWSTAVISSVTDTQSLALDYLTQLMSDLVNPNLLGDVSGIINGSAPGVSTFLGEYQNIGSLFGSPSATTAATVVKSLASAMKDAVLVSGLRGEVADSTVDSLSAALDEIGEAAGEVLLGEFFQKVILEWAGAHGDTQGQITLTKLATIPFAPAGGTGSSGTSGGSGSSGSGSSGTPPGSTTTTTTNAPPPTGGSSTTTTTTTTTTTVPPSQQVTAFNNYGTANEPGHPMCRGNGNDAASEPAGVVTQTFTVPAGVATLNSAKIQIDPAATVTANLTVSDGGMSVTSSAVASGDTVFNFGALQVQPGDLVTMSLTFVSTSGSIITVYDAGASSMGGTMTVQNSCAADTTNWTSSNSALRAVVYGAS
jgi:hypothetical protein